MIYSHNAYYNNAKINLIAVMWWKNGDVWFNLLIHHDSISCTGLNLYRSEFVI